MQITVPESWRGIKGLFGNAQQQGSSLACFFPINEYDYQQAPPYISVDAPTRNAPAQVNITDTIIMTDGPEAAQTWYQELWSVTKFTWGYQIAFQPQKLTSTSGHGPWTVTLEAPDLNIQDPAGQPTTDDGHGTLTWVFPSSQRLPTEISVSLTSPWSVRMNLASDRWPMRWFADASWTLDDGVVVDIVALWIGWRLLRRRRGDSERRRLPITVMAISAVSIIGYIGYVLDDYLWNYSNSDTVWEWESIGLVAITAFYFMRAFGTRWYWVLTGWVPPVVATALITLYDFPLNLSRTPVSYYYHYSGPPHRAAVENLLILMTPLLLAVFFTIAATALWLSRLWPFGKKKRQGYLRKLSDTPFNCNSRVIMLLLGMFILSGLILGQSAAASHYYWLHSDLWDQGAGAFNWIATDVLNDTHWWIGDGLQWGLGFAVVGGIFAMLWAMSGYARGVFFGSPRATSIDKPGDGEPRDRVDLAQLTAVVACVFIGTWGFYDGVSLPLPFIVAFVGLAAWGLTRILSKLDWKSVVENRGIDSSSVAVRSVLVYCRSDLLNASGKISGGLKAPKGTTSARSGSGADTPEPDGESNALQAIIRLESQSSADQGTQYGQRRQPSELKLLKPVDPGVIALALGPADTWWDNGVTAARMGAYLVIIPIAFDIYILWNTGNLSLLNFPFGLQDALGNIISTLLGWLSGLFMFGVLVPYLRGFRTPVKGVVFGLIAFAALAADAGVRHALGVAPYPTFVTDGLLGVALFATVGLLLDICTLRSHNDQGLINSIYRLGNVKVAVTYATTLIVVAIGLWQAVYLTGQNAQQRAQNISTTAQYVNSVGGTGAPSNQP